MVAAQDMSAGVSAAGCMRKWFEMGLRMYMELVVALIRQLYHSSADRRGHSLFGIAVQGWSMLK